MAFHIAGAMCFKEAMAKAAPVLLEPIMKVEVTTVSYTHLDVYKRQPLFSEPSPT